MAIVSEAPLEGESYEIVSSVVYQPRICISSLSIYKQTTTNDVGVYSYSYMAPSIFSANPQYCLRYSYMAPKNGQRIPKTQHIPRSVCPYLNIKMDKRIRRRNAARDVTLGPFHDGGRAECLSRLLASVWGASGDGVAPSFTKITAAHR